MRLRIRGPSGQHAITVPDDATVGDLRATISEVTKIQSYELKFGYPPQPLELDALSDSMKLQDSNLKLSGERLIVSERAESTKPIADDKKVSAEPVAQSGSSTKSSNKKLPVSRMKHLYLPLSRLFRCIFPHVITYSIL